VRTIKLKEFASAEELREHYRQLQERVSRRRPPPPPPLTPEPPPPKLTDPEADRIGWLNRSILIKIIMWEVSRHYGMTPEILKSPERTRNVKVARFMAVYMLREIMKMPLTKIAHFVGYDDHTSALHALKMMEKMIEITDVKYAVTDIRTKVTEKYMREVMRRSQLDIGG